MEVLTTFLVPLSQKDNATNMMEELDHLKHNPFSFISSAVLENYLKEGDQEIGTYSFLYDNHILIEPKFLKI